MEQVQTSSLRLADATQARIEALWDAHEAGNVTLDDFRAMAKVIVAQANTAGVQLADIGLAAEVTRQLGRLTEPLGLAPTPVQVDEDRILRDVDHIIERNLDTVTAEELPDSRRKRLGEWARSEPLLTVATATQMAMTGQGATGWVRQVDADPCPLCLELADGVTRSTNVRMARHPGCACIQSPSFTAAPAPAPGSTASFTDFLSQLDADVASLAGSTIGSRVESRGVLISNP